MINELKINKTLVVLVLMLCMTFFGCGSPSNTVTGIKPVRPADLETFVKPADYAKKPSGLPYEIVNIVPPTVLEVGGMDIDAKGMLYMCTRRGEVWTLHKDKWVQYTFGLHEPLGLLCDKEGVVYVLQRSELSKLVDEDGDGKADYFETICNDWGYSGNYHEFAIGLKRDHNGDFFINLGLGLTKGDGTLGKWNEGSGRWLGAVPKIKWRGWHCKVTKEGKLVPLAAGIRAPNGMGLSPEGDIFITDNQGSFVATGAFYHPEKGDFLGQGEALVFGDGLIKEKGLYDKIKVMDNKTRLTYLNSFRKRPVFYIPLGALGRSCSHPTWDVSKGKFGPFSGQVFIGDVQYRTLMRGTYEKVKGQYQGACYPFIVNNEKLGGGNNRLSFTKDGELYVGQTGRGWAAGVGLKKIKWNGVAHMELKEVKLTKTGFDLYFTKPINKEQVKDLNNFKVTRMYYPYTNNYNNGAKSKGIPVSKAVVSEDGLKVSLTVKDVIVDHSYKIECRSITSTFKEKVQFGQAYYTVNNLK